LVFSPFLRSHWVHDSYLIRMYGYRYMVKAGINAGRPVTSLFYTILDGVGLPYRWTMALSVSATVVLLSFAAFIVFYMARSRISDGEHDIKRDALLFMGSMSIFFNLFLPDSLLFFENSVVALGVLLTVISCLLFVRGGRLNLGLSLAFHVAGVFCYQSDISYFLPFVILFTFMGSKHSVKSAALRLSIACGFYAAAMAANYGFIRLVGSNDRRVTGGFDLGENLRLCGETLGNFFRDNFGFMPDYLFTLFLLAFTAVLVYNAVRSRKYSPLIVTGVSVAALIVCALLPHLPMRHFYVMPRSGIALAAMGGLLMVCAAMTSRKVKTPIVLLFALFILVIGQRQIDIQKNNYANNHMDMREVAYIGDAILHYEAESGIPVAKIVAALDPAPQFFRPYLKNYEDITIRVLTVPWMVHPMVSEYLGRDYVDEFMEFDEFKERFGGGGTAGPDFAQLVFVDDVLYICIY